MVNKEKQNQEELKTLKDLELIQEVQDRVKAEAIKYIKEDRKDAFELQKFIMKGLGKYDNLEDYDIKDVLMYFFNITDADLTELKGGRTSK